MLQIPVLNPVELDYKQITSNVTSTQTVEASATALITGNSVIFDGATTVMIYVQASLFGCSAVTGFILNIWEDSTDLGRITQTPSLANVLPLHGELRRTPAAGAHVYSIRGWVNSAATGTIYATAPQVPAFLRVLRV